MTARMLLPLRCLRLLPGTSWFVSWPSLDPLAPLKWPSFSSLRSFNWWVGGRMEDVWMSDLQVGSLLARCVCVMVWWCDGAVRRRLHLFIYIIPEEEDDVGLIFLHSYLIKSNKMWSYIFLYWCTYRLHHMQSCNHIQSCNFVIIYCMTG